MGFRRDYTCGTCNGEEIVQTTNLQFGAVKTVVGKLSRMLQVRVLPGAPPSFDLRSNEGAKFCKIDLVVVGVAQLVEPRIVIPVVVGSSPIVHPIFW